MVEIAASFMNKVEAAVEEDGGAGEGLGGDGEAVEKGVWPAEPLPEPPDEAGPVGWPMPEFCPLTVDGAVKESFLETLRKEAPPREGEALSPSPDSRPLSSKRPRPGTASSPLPPPSSRSPYRNILQVFQQCKQDVA